MSEMSTRAFFYRVPSCTSLTPTDVVPAFVDVALGALGGGWGVTDTVASDYLRAFQASGEMSERALAITRFVLEFNPSHYTAWWFRRR